MTPSSPIWRQPDGDYFDRLYAANADPWSLTTRWYERRKRALLAACLPRERYRSAFEPGCAGGQFTRLLAGRCDKVLAVDRHECAVSQTRAALASHAHVTVAQCVLPDDWPPRMFDLIVISELGYYFDPASFARLAASAAASLSGDGLLVACHWRHDFDGRAQSTESVHAALAAHIGLTCQVEHREPDFLLQCWSPESRSLAVKEGLA